MSCLKMIHVGVGGRGRMWLQTMQSLPELFESVALVDVNMQALRDAAEASGTDSERCFRDFKQACKAVAADTCCIASPSAYHVRLAELAMESGLHVLVEKPLANSWEAAVSVVRKAETTGKRLMVAHHHRYGAAETTIRKLIMQKALGDPGYVTIVRHCHRPQAGSWTSDHPMLLEMSCHDFDTLLSLFRGRRAMSVLCRSFSPLWSSYPGSSAVNVMMEIEGGIEVNYAGSLTSAIDSFECRIECSNGAIVFDGESVRAVAAGGTPEPVPVPNHERAVEEQLAAEFHDFVVAGREPDVSGRSTLRTMQVVCGCIESAESKKVVKLTA